MNIAQNGMPDLSDLPRLMPDAILNWTLGNRGLNPAISAFVATYVRIFDDALAEYNAARASLEVLVTSKGSLPELFRTTSHLENCVNKVRRLLRVLEKISSRTSVDRLDRKAIAAVAQDFIDVRNGVEHMDDMLAHGEIAEVDPAALMLDLDGKGARVGQWQLSFDRLAIAFRRFRKIGADFIEAENPLRA